MPTVRPETEMMMIDSTPSLKSSSRNSLARTGGTKTARDDRSGEDGELPELIDEEHGPPPDLLDDGHHRGFLVGGDTTSSSRSAAIAAFGSKKPAIRGSVRCRSSCGVPSIASPGRSSST